MFPQAHCPRCGGSLRDVVNPAKHLARCEELAAAAAAAAAEVAQHLPQVERAPSLWRRLLASLGMATRGADR
jgi:hypothetical protein